MVFASNLSLPHSESTICRNNPVLTAIVGTLPQQAILLRITGDLVTVGEVQNTGSTTVDNVSVVAIAYGAAEQSILQELRTCFGVWTNRSSRSESSFLHRLCHQLALTRAGNPMLPT